MADRVAIAADTCGFSPLDPAAAQQGRGGVAEIQALTTGGARLVLPFAVAASATAV